MKAIQIANELFKTNAYQEMKQFENEKKAIEQELKNRMGDERRIVHHSSGTVTKFVANNTYKIDAQGLNDFLYSYGILSETVKFNTKDLNEIVINQIAPFKNPLEYYVKLNVRLPKEKFNLQDTSTKELIKRWNIIAKAYKNLSDDYKKAREEMNTCKELIKKGKLEFDNGTISRIKKEQTYNIKAIQLKYGIPFVINHASPVIGKIETFIEQGYIEPSEIDQFKTLIDMNFKFVVTTLDEESKLMNFLTRKNSKASITREAIRHQEVVGMD